MPWAVFIVLNFRFVRWEDPPTGRATVVAVVARIMVAKRFPGLKLSRTVGTECEIVFVPRRVV